MEPAAAKLTRTRSALCGTFGALGAASVMVQAVLVRECLSVFHGSELTLGIALGSWLLWIALGAQVGSAVSRRPALCEWLFVTLLVIGAAAPFAQVSALREARSLLTVPAYEYIPIRSAALLIALATGPFALVVGLTFPLGVRLLADEGRASSAGALYGWEAVGFLVGGLVFTFALVPRLSAFEVLSVTLVLLVGAAVILALSRRGTALTAVTSFLALGALLLPVRAGQIESLTQRGRWQAVAPQYELVAVHDTPYQNVAIGEYYGQYTVYTNGHVATSFPDVYTHGLTANFVLLQHPNPRRVLLIGNGAEGVIQETLKGPIEALDYVQIDAGLLQAIRPYLDTGDRAALEDRRVRVIHEDARAYVRATDERYDLVFCNVGDPSTAAANRFFTIDFFREIDAVLSDGGVFGTRLTSAANVVGEEIGYHTGSVYHSLREVFADVEVTWDSANYLFASQQPGVLSVDPKELGRRFTERGIETDTFTEYHSEVLLAEGRSQAMAAALSRDRYAVRNTDLAPVSYYYNLLLWDRLSGSQLAPLLVWVQQNVLPLLAASALLAGALRYLAGLGARVERGRPRPHPRRGGSKPPSRSAPAAAALDRFDAAFGIFALGLCGMGLEVAFLFAFQCLFGSLYQMVALVVAVFMAGLAGASLWVTRAMQGAPSPRRALAIVALSMGLLSAGVHIGLIRAAHWAADVWMPLAYCALLLGVALAGALTGAAFPLAARAHEAASGDSARSAGAIDAADHLGGALGAMLLGSLLIPFLGLWGASAIPAVAAFGAAAMLWRR